MTHRDDAARMRHMLDHAREAVQLAAGRSRADLDADRTFNLAMTRLLEIIGEAAARVSEVTRQQHSQIRWPAIAGMRHRLIHGYDSVDFDILWNVVEVDLPPLILELTSILEPP
jgi:uncharacterized protein with HEPN domain